MGLSRIFDISRRSLAVYQRSLDVTAHNISNANNPDYTRQRTIVAPENPEINAGFVWGSGIKITDIERVRDSLIDKQIINYNQKYSDSNRQSEILSQVEQLFAEPGDQGMSNLISSFFNSFQELSVTPNSIPLRNSVINSAQNLSTKITELNNDLDVVKTDLMADFKTKVDSLNELLQNIGELNGRIFEQKSLGQSPNDLMDERDKAISDLSNLVNVTVSYTDKGSAVISLGGVFATDGSYTVKFDIGNINGKLALVTADKNNTVALSGGELNALAEVYNNKIPSYSESIDTIANQIVESVNTIHSAGYDLLGSTGSKFFDGYQNGVLQINQDILDDRRRIAISADGTSGNGDLAKQIGELADQKVLDGSTFTEKYASLINKVGTDKVSNDNLTSSNKLVLDQLTAQRSSYSGVSVDEEMTDILKFQRAYDASAKLIKVADDMLQTLLNMV